MKKVVLAVSLITGLAAAACAQGDGPPPPAPPPHGRHFPGAMHRFAGGMGIHPWKIVAGAPYSATVTQEFAQTLANGTTISHTSTGQVARDSSGRTYQQQPTKIGPFAGGQTGSKTIVFITDPVAGYSYVLNTAKQTAIRRPFHAHPANRKPFRLNRRRRNNPDVTVTDLGTQADAASGLELQGKRITRTIPQGAIGNSEPITSTSEIWYSPALQIVVRSTRNDPRFGKTSYTLSDIVQGEPNPSLFTIPADYTVKDARRGRGGFRFHGNRPSLK